MDDESDEISNLNLSLNPTRNRYHQTVPDYDDMGNITTRIRQSLDRLDDFLSTIRSLSNENVQVNNLADAVSNANENMARVDELRQNFTRRISGNDGIDSDRRTVPEVINETIPLLENAISQVNNLENLFQRQILNPNLQTKKSKVENQLNLKIKDFKNKIIRTLPNYMPCLTTKDIILLPDQEIEFEFKNKHEKEIFMMAKSENYLYQNCILIIPRIQFNSQENEIYVDAINNEQNFGFGFNNLTPCSQFGSIAQIVECKEYENFIKIMENDQKFAKFDNLSFNTINIISIIEFIQKFTVKLKCIKLVKLDHIIFGKVRIFEKLHFKKCDEDLLEKMVDGDIIPRGSNFVDYESKQSSNKLRRKNNNLEYARDYYSKKWHYFANIENEYENLQKIGSDRLKFDENFILPKQYNKSILHNRFEKLKNQILNLMIKTRLIDFTDDIVKLGNNDANYFSKNIDTCYQFTYAVLNKLPLSNIQKSWLANSSDYIGKMSIIYKILKIISSKTFYHCSQCKNRRTKLFTASDFITIPNLTSKSAIGCYVNPNGVVHDTITVKDGENLTRSVFVKGIKPIVEHSWFPGYGWLVAYCDFCNNHLGWKFKKVDQNILGPETFYGLTRNGIDLCRLNENVDQENQNLDDQPNDSNNKIEKYLHLTINDYRYLLFEKSKIMAVETKDYWEKYAAKWHLPFDENFPELNESLPLSD